MSSPQENTKQEEEEAEEKDEKDKDDGGGESIGGRGRGGSGSTGDKVRTRDKVRHLYSVPGTLSSSTTDRTFPFFSLLLSKVSRARTFQTNFTSEEDKLSCYLPSQNKGGREEREERKKKKNYD